MTHHDAKGLPQWLRTLYVAITEFPSTNGIKVQALILICLTGVALAIAWINDANVSEGVLAVWLSTLLVMLGFGALQSREKWRLLPQPAAEDVAAVHGTPDPTEEGTVTEPKPDSEEAVG